MYTNKKKYTVSTFFRRKFIKRDTAKLKEKLIQIGIEQIRKKGIDQLSLRTIAGICDVTHGTPYRHFKSKEEYLKIVLAEIAAFLNHEIDVGVDEKSSRGKLIQMGFNLINFAKNYPNFFEALFVKFPFKYMNVTEETILLERDLPGFYKFKSVVLALRREEKFVNSESEMLFHFWSFITGLAVLVNSPIGKDLDDNAIQDNIEHMLDIYIKGGQL